MNYPNGLDNFIDPVANNKLNAPSHSAIERAQNAALSAIEAYLGTIGSTSVTSITFQLNHLDPSHITGVVPVSAGGTGATSTTAGFDNISPLTTLGDLLTFGPTSNPANVRFPRGNNLQILRTNISATAYGLQWIDNPGDYSVTTSEDIYTWFTFQIPAPFINSSGTIGGAWTNTLAAAQTGGAGRSITTANAVSNVMRTSASIGTGTLLNSKKFKLKFKGSLLGTYSGANDGAGIGIGNPSFNLSSAVTAFQIMITNGVFYFVTGDNVANTTTILSGITASDWNLYTITFDGTDAKCYVNGVLKATHNTNIPTSWTSEIAGTAFINGGLGSIALSPVTVSLEQ